MAGTTFHKSRGSFLFHLLLFLLPVLALLIIIEISSRQNTYKARAKYIDRHKSEIEIIILGTSQNRSAINPAFLDRRTAYLAHSGSAMNMDYLLFNRFYPEFPKLKYVIVETSRNALTKYKGTSWRKNHLYLIYYRINNYGRKPPVKEHFLLGSQFTTYFYRFFHRKLPAKDTRFNEYGFFIHTDSHFERLNYDSLAIREFLSGKYTGDTVTIKKG